MLSCMYEDWIGGGRGLSCMRTGLNDCLYEDWIVFMRTALYL